LNLSRFATENLKAILFTVAVLCVMGVFAYRTFPVSILPDVTFPRVIVIADSGERPIQSMEATITRPLEDAITTIPNVARIRSQIERGSTEISIDFGWGTDILTAEQLVNAKVNEVRPELPAETHTETERMNPTVFPVLGLTLDSGSLSQTELFNLAQYSIRPRLARISGVARVIVQGGLEPEVQVTVDQNAMQSLKLSLPDIVQAVSSSNEVRSVGRVNDRYQTLTVMVDGQAADLKAIGDITVATKNGVPVALRQVAQISNRAKDRVTVISANGRECVLINVVRQPTANTVAMAAAVKAELDSIRRDLPGGAKLGVFYDQSLLVQDAVQSVEEAVLIGGILAVAVLLLFLHDVRATVVTAVIIPLTVLIAFLLMRMAGLTLNLMTLGALAVGIGLIVDDAIVVVENVFKHLALDPDLRTAVTRASGEIARPMISSTLTTVVVFLPLSLLQGVAGAFFSALAITLTIALMVSLALALTVSPSLCAAFLGRKREHAYGPIFRAVLRIYEGCLGWCVRHRWAVPIGAIATLVLTFLIAQKLPTGFMPAMDEGAFVLDYIAPPGTTLEESDRLLRKVDKILQETPEIESFSRRTGTELGFSITEPNRGDYAVMLKKNRSRAIEDVISDVRGKITEEVPGLDVDFSQVLQDLIGDLSGAPAPIEIQIFGSNQESIEGVAQDLATKFGKIKGLADVKSGVIQLGPSWTLKIDPGRAGRYGMNTSSVSEQAETAILGTVATDILQGDRSVGVRVRFPGPLRTSPSAIAEIPIQTPSGASVPLSAVGSFALQAGTNEIFRQDQRRMVSPTANLEGIDLGTAVGKVRKILDAETLPPGVTMTIGGQYRSQSESFQNLLQVLVLAILLVYAVMLYQFKAFTSPTVILLVMPLGLFGAVVGLWATGTALNVSSFMGAIMLVGIVVKNGILLLDRAQEAEKNGMSTLEAVIEAGRQRLRPILMTTLTAILGLFPLALNIGAGAEMQKPLAVTVIGGLAFSTLVTLVAAPTLYVIFAANRPRRSPATSDT
jgi:CzcA family heavy metal efflux pump